MRNYDYYKEHYDITYQSETGFFGVLYGEKLMSIFDSEGRERLHTGSRRANTLEELKKCVENFPSLLESAYKRGKV